MQIITINIRCQTLVEIYKTVRFDHPLNNLF